MLIVKNLDEIQNVNQSFVPETLYVNQSFVPETLYVNLTASSLLSWKPTKNCLTPPAVTL